MRDQIVTKRKPHSVHRNRPCKEQNWQLPQYYRPRLSAGRCAQQNYGTSGRRSTISFMTAHVLADITTQLSDPGNMLKREKW